MNRALLPLVTLGLLAWGAWTGRAQEPVPPPNELPQPEEKIPPPVPAEGVPPPAPDCHHDKTHEGVKVLWLEREVPVQVLVPREIITEEKRPTLEVFYRDEKRKVVEMVVKETQVPREIPFTTVKPCTEICPSTGHPITVMKPCVETRVVKETVFYTVPQEREIIVKVPFIKEVEEIVPRKTVILEYKTELQRRPSALAIPTVEKQTRWLLTPKPPCPDHEPHP
jgi:hypothetical protein